MAFEIFRAKRKPVPFPELEDFLDYWVGAQEDALNADRVVQDYIKK